MNMSTLRFFQTNLHSGAVNSIETPSSEHLSQRNHPEQQRLLRRSFLHLQSVLPWRDTIVLTRAVPAPLAEPQHLRIVAFEVTAWTLICIVALSSRKPSAGAGLTPTLSDFGVMVGIGSL